ncbi:cobalamin B12-binding domain-containing protein [Umezawaea tangerina]|uniref:Methanogenic corrinoid protein MtbC1 n=1 Tax=Umezawaea tangerina TaxID=84725 RepID=A0A2T0TH85_9PSEU|nr:B12-binding domain-containing protein [Umezawaea tangerina]PRY44975.1 methanogenic corrinoid protein MtbC1 [Umezawaea tangerina]
MTALSGAAAAYDDALVAGDAAGAVALVQGLVAEGADPLAVLVEVIGACQRAVGDRWECGRWTVGQEHAATAVAISATGVVARLADHVPVTKGRVVVACAQREWHTLSAMIVSTAMRLLGWDTVTLGAGTAPARLAHCLDNARVDVTAISCTVLGALPAARRLIEVSTAAGIPTLVGGAAFGADARRALALGATAWASDVYSAEALLDSLAGTVPKAVVPAGRRVAEQSAIELRHHGLVEAVKGRWSATATHTASDVGDRDRFSTACDGVLRQALHSVGATLLTGDVRSIPVTAAWVDRVLTARGAKTRQTAELGGLLADALHEFPAARDLVVRHWAEDLVLNGGCAQ